MADDLSTECPGLDCCLDSPYPVTPASVVEIAKELVARLSRLVWILPNETTQDMTTEGALFGDPTKLYTVVVKIRGVIEAKNYNPPAFSPPIPGSIVAGSGTSTPNCFQYTGVVPIVGGVIMPIVPVDGINEYGLYISDPPQYYMLNNQVGMETSDMYVAGYSFSFQIRGNAHVTLTARMINGGQFGNLTLLGCSDNRPPLAYPGAPAAIAGQWMQMDVLSIEEA